MHNSWLLTKFERNLIWFQQCAIYWSSYETNKQLEIYSSINSDVNVIHIFAIPNVCISAKQLINRKYMFFSINIAQPNCGQFIFDMNQMWPVGMELCLTFGNSLLSFDKNNFVLSLNPMYVFGISRSIRQAKSIGVQCTIHISK